MALPISPTPTLNRWDAVRFEMCIAQSEKNKAPIPHRSIAPSVLSEIVSAVRARSRAEVVAQ